MSCSLSHTWWVLVLTVASKMGFVRSNTVTYTVKVVILETSVLSIYRRYVSQCQRYKYFRFGQPYCYSCSWCIDSDTVWYRVHVLNIELCFTFTQKLVINFQAASISELECKLFLLPVSAAILNLLYITGRTFTHMPPPWLCALPKSAWLCEG